MTELPPAMALPTIWQAKLTGTLNGVMARTTPHGTRYRNSKDHPPEALKQNIDRGELGVKTGKGFYSYPDPEFLRDDLLSTKG